MANCCLQAKHSLLSLPVFTAALPRVNGTNCQVFFFALMDADSVQQLLDYNGRGTAFGTSLENSKGVDTDGVCGCGACIDSLLACS